MASKSSAPIPPSQRRWVGTAAYIFGTIWIGFGINALVQPEQAISFFELAPPKTDPVFFKAIMAVYATRDIFVGLALYASEAFGSRKVTGWILLATSALAWADGVICKVLVGTGEMNHWGYAPAITIIAVLALGLLDG